MVNLVLELSAVPSKEVEIQRLLQAIIGPTTAHPGCRRCRLLRDLSDPAEICLLQEWESREYLERYLRTETFRWLLLAMDLSSTRPELKFHFVDHTRGIDLVEEPRNVEGDGRRGPWWNGRPAGTLDASTPGDLNQEGERGP